MEYRIGKCSQCGAEYKVPASFAHSAARCKLCQGVVHLGSRAAAPAQAADAGRTEPERAAAAAPERAQRPPAERGQPARASFARPRDGGPVAGPPAETEPVRATRAQRQSEPAAVPEPAAPQARERGGSAGARLPLIALLVVALVALALFLLREKVFGGRGDAPAPRSDAPSNAPGSPDPETAPPPLQTPAETREGRLPDAGGAPSPVSRAPSGAGPATDLRTVPELSPSADTPTAEWLKLEEWAHQWLDEDAGPAGELAGRELEQQGRKAVPAVLNFLVRQDLASPEGRRAGDKAAPFLRRVSNGADFGWPAHAAGSDDVQVCTRALAEWAHAWQRCEADIEAWIALARLDQLDPAESARLRATFGSSGGAAPPASEPDD